jgi:hypothetical protein
MSADAVSCAIDFMVMDFGSRPAPSAPPFGGANSQGTSSESLSGGGGVVNVDLLLGPGQLILECLLWWLLWEDAREFNRFVCS